MKIIDETTNEKGDLQRTWQDDDGKVWQGVVGKDGVVAHPKEWGAAAKKPAK